MGTTRKKKQWRDTRLGSWKEDHETHSRSCEGPWTLFSELKEVCALCMNVCMYLCTCECVFTSMCCVFICACLCICGYVLSHFSCVPLFAASWTVALQAPPSMGFSRQEYWSGLPLPSPVCVYIYARLHVYICIYRYVYVHLCICVCECVYICVCIFICFYTYVRGGHVNPFQYSCLENPHGQGSLVDYSP